MRRPNTFCDENESKLETISDVNLNLTETYFMLMLLPFFSDPISCFREQKQINKNDETRPLKYTSAKNPIIL